MAIHTAPVISDKIYLGDLSAEVKQMEGDCAQEDRAWVIIQQGNEGDNRRISEMNAETRTIWHEEGTEQVQRVNRAAVRALQVFLTLADAGNIFADAGGKIPLFKFAGGKVAQQRQEFEKAYGSLHPAVSRSIILAVYRVNPMWDWRIEQHIECPECSHKFPILDEHLVPLAAMAELEPQDS
jgi:hypothetical protein